MLTAPGPSTSAIFTDFALASAMRGADDLRALAGLGARLRAATAAAFGRSVGMSYVGATDGRSWKGGADGVVSDTAARALQRCNEILSSFTMLSR